MKLKIHYGKNKLPVSDFEVEEYVKHAIEEYRVNGVNNFYTCNENIILCFRVYIKEGKLKHDEVEFHYNGEVLNPDKDGRIAHWLEGFCDTNIKLLERMFDL